MRRLLLNCLVALAIASFAATPAFAGLMVTFSSGGNSATIFDDNPLPLTSGTAVTATGDVSPFAGFIFTNVIFDFSAASGVQGYAISFTGDSNSPGDSQGRLHEFVTTVEATTGTAFPLVIELYSDGFDSPGADGSLMTLFNHLESVEFKAGATGSVSYQSETDSASTSVVSTTTDVNDLVSSAKFIRDDVYKLVGRTTISLNSAGRVDIEANTIASLPEAGSMIMWGTLVCCVGAIVFFKRRKHSGVFVS
jgi:hypothetical protein